MDTFGLKIIASDKVFYEGRCRKLIIPLSASKNRSYTLFRGRCSVDCDNVEMFPNDVYYGRPAVKVLRFKKLNEVEEGHCCQGYSILVVEVEFRYSTLL